MGWRMVSSHSKPKQLYEDRMDERDLRGPRSAQTPCKGSSALVSLRSSLPSIAFIG